MSAALSLHHAVAPSDAEIARRVAQGDHRAFELLMRRNNRTLFRTARAIVRDDTEAEDVLQEAYLSAYRSIGMFRNQARLTTWLVRIVANEASARRRKEVRRAEIVPIRDGGIEDLGFDAEVVMRDHDGPEDMAQRSELRHLLETKIDALPDAFRIVFVLRALEEFSVEEVAAILSIPEATVRTRFFRARSQLREALSLEIDLACDGAFAFAGARCDRIVARVMARLTARGIDLR